MNIETMYSHSQEPAPAPTPAPLPMPDSDGGATDGGWGPDGSPAGTGNPGPGRTR